MRMRIANTIVVALLGLGVSAAVACPGKGKAKSGCDKPCGAKSAITVADKPVDDGRSETDVKTAKGGCNRPCGQSAITVSDKPAEAKTAKGGCSKPCGGKGHEAVTTGHEGCPSGCSKDCCKNKGAVLTSGKSHPCPHAGESITESKCPIRQKTDSVLASMPTMKYRVGKEVTYCSKSAKASSEQSGKPIQYVVGGNNFSKKSDAVAKLTSLLEDGAEEFQTIQYVVGGKPYHCAKSAAGAARRSNKGMTYRVGGVDFTTQEEAEEALISIEKAVSNVKLSYKVGDNTYCCSKTAAAKAKEAGKELTFVVGDAETGCEKTAKMNLAEAKIRAIVEAAVRTSLSL